MKNIQNSNNPIVSIIVPMYNCESTILETINSVKHQTYSNWELICVDDGSSDSSFNIVLKESRSDSRIKLLKRERQPKGGSVCRNIGSSISKGKYLIFLDGDDVLKKDCVEKRLNKIEETNYDFIIMRHAVFADDISKAICSPQKAIEKEKYKLHFACLSPIWQTTSTFWNKTFYESIHGFDKGFSRFQDIEIHLRALIESKDNFVFYYNEEPDCYHRKSKNESVSREKFRSALPSVKKFICLLLSSQQSFSKREFSHCSLILICNIYYILHKAQLNASLNKEFDSMSNKRIEKVLLFPDIFLYRLLRFFNGNFYLTRMLKKIMVWK